MKPDTSLIFITSVEDAMAIIQKLVFDFDLLGLILQNSLMSFDREYKNWFLIMGTNVTPTIAHLYMAMLEMNYANKCTNHPKF